jgi:hypothetical protein
MTSSPRRAKILTRVPPETIEWLTENDNPAVAALTRGTLLGEPAREAGTLWASRNRYAPVAAILDAQNSDGSWDTPGRDYRKYGGSLWQVIFLGELQADGEDERVRRAADYAFSRQLPDGSWSVNHNPSSSLPCLTANVARGLAAMGWERDERVVAALAYVAQVYRQHGTLACPAGGTAFSLNGYCHMLAPKLLLLLGAVPQDVWPDGAVELRDGCVDALRARQVFRCLPAGSREFADAVYSAPAAERDAVRARLVAEIGPLEYGEKPGWLRFGFPLSYNSDILEALAGLQDVGEERREEYEPAIAAVEAGADVAMRWPLRNTFNGKMIADVEVKGAPSKWLTLRALRVLDHFAAPGA